MSIRTIIEVNHDCIQRLVAEGHISGDLYHQICAAYTNACWDHKVDGIRILGSRHHSETLELTVE